MRPTKDITTANKWMCLTSPDAVNVLGLIDVIMSAGAAERAQVLRSGRGERGPEGGEGGRAWGGSPAVLLL